MVVIEKEQLDLVVEHIHDASALPGYDCLNWVTPYPTAPARSGASTWTTAMPATKLGLTTMMSPSWTGKQQWTRPSSAPAIYQIPHVDKLKEIAVRLRPEGRHPLNLYENVFRRRSARKISRIILSRRCGNPCRQRHAVDRVGNRGGDGYESQDSFHRVIRCHRPWQRVGGYGRR
jgi:hypothetical protein